LTHPIDEDEAVTIPRRFRGPPESANGGYTCGLLARRLHGFAARVRLQRPPPLDHALLLHSTAEENVELRDGDQLVASGAAVETELNVPAPVGYEEAVHASSHYRWRTGHPFPGCFVCGTERHQGDGLCIFPGRVPERTVVAGPWIPHPSVCDAAGLAQLEIVWAALDCPSWFGILEHELDATFGLLGELTGRVLRRPEEGERCVVVGWRRRERAARKLYGGAALYTADGVLLGSSEATWIEPRI
jgi:hypothetical protein